MASTVTEALAQALDQIFVLVRPDKRDQRRPFAQELGFVDSRAWRSARGLYLLMIVAPDLARVALDSGRQPFRTPPSPKPPRPRSHSRSGTESRAWRALGHGLGSHGHCRTGRISLTIPTFIKRTPKVAKRWVPYAVHNLRMAFFSNGRVSTMSARGQRAVLYGEVVDAEPVARASVRYL